MVSEWFSISAAERKKRFHDSDDEVANEVKLRLKTFHDFIYTYFDKYGGNQQRTRMGDGFVYVLDRLGQWYVATKFSAAVDQDGYPIRYYVSRPVFDDMVRTWNLTEKKPIDEQDWRYMLMQVLREDGAKVSWHDSTLAICMDIPPVCELVNPQVVG